MFKVCVFADKIMYVLPVTITQHLPTSLWWQNRKKCNQDYQISVVPKTGSVLVTVALGVVSILVTHTDDHFPCMKHEINTPHKTGYIFQLHSNLHTNTASVAAMQVCGTVQIKKVNTSATYFPSVSLPHYIYIYTVPIIHTYTKP